MLHGPVVQIPVVSGRLYIALAGVTAIRMPAKLGHAAALLMFLLSVTGPRTNDRQ